jgi:HD superfamily phosphohydrolase
MSGSSSIVKKAIKIALVLASVTIATGVVLKHTSNSHDHPHTVVVFGDEYRFDDELKAIVDSEAMQRMKGVDQSGPPRYFGPNGSIVPKFSRYEHSIGVCALMKKFGASLKGQIVGLLHDASHTVFSHVGDYIFARNINENVQEAYQDKTHLDVMQKSKIEAILKKFGMSIEDLDTKNNKLLDQPLPDMCIDRIQYNIHTGVILGLISEDDANKIINNIKFEDDKFFFTDRKLAKKLADISLYLTSAFWGAEWNTSMNIHLAHALRTALHVGAVMIEELYSRDEVVMDKLLKSNNKTIQLYIQQCKNPHVKIESQQYRTEHFTPKFRGIDPLVDDGTGKLKRLTELDIMFKNQFEVIKKRCKEGYDLELLSIRDEVPANP